MRDALLSIQDEMKKMVKVKVMVMEGRIGRQADGRIVQSR